MFLERLLLLLVVRLLLHPLLDLDEVVDHGFDLVPHDCFVDDPLFSLSHLHFGLDLSFPELQLVLLSLLKPLLLHELVGCFDVSQQYLGAKGSIVAVSEHPENILVVDHSVFVGVHNGSHEEDAALVDILRYKGLDDPEELGPGDGALKVVEQLLDHRPQLVAQVFKVVFEHLVQFLRIHLLLLIPNLVEEILHGSRLILSHKLYFGVLILDHSSHSFRHPGFTLQKLKVLLVLAVGPAIGISHLVLSGVKLPRIKPSGLRAKVRTSSSVARVELVMRLLISIASTQAVNIGTGRD